MFHSSIATLAFAFEFSVLSFKWKVSKVRASVMLPLSGTVELRANPYQIFVMSLYTYICNYTHAIILVVQMALYYPCYRCFKVAIYREDYNSWSSDI